MENIIKDINKRVAFLRENAAKTSKYAAYRFAADELEKIVSELRENKNQIYQEMKREYLKEDILTQLEQHPDVPDVLYDDGFNEETLDSIIITAEHKLGKCDGLFDHYWGCINDAITEVFNDDK